MQILNTLNIPKTPTKHIFSQTFRSNNPFPQQHHKHVSRYTTNSPPAFSKRVLVNRLLPTANVGSKLFENPAIRDQFRRHFISSPKRWNSQEKFTCEGVLRGLIYANVGVYLLWKVADTNFMIQNFSVQYDNIKSGRYHTLITHAFSHVSLLHIVANMVGLYSFGKSLGRIITPGSLLKLYIAGALGGALAYLADCSYRASEPEPSSEDSRPHPKKRIAVGASGAVTAMVCLDTLLFPREKVLLYFIIPVPSILVGIYMIWADVKRVKDDSLISGAAHLGGAAVGAIAWAQLRWRRRL